MVGQKVAAQASDKQAMQTYKDAEALLKIEDEVHRLVKMNNELTEEIHSPDFDGLDLRTQRYQLVKKYWGTTEG